MSDSDSFIDEVTQELRRDRMFRLWRRYGVFVIGAIVLIVAVSGYFAWRNAQQEQAARDAGARLIAASEIESPEARAEAYLALTGEENGALVARFAAAAALAEAGDADRAAAEFDAIANDTSLDQAYRDLAALKSAQHQFAARAPEETIAALEPLVAEGAPYRLLALETRAAAHLAAGDEAAARSDLETILASEVVTQELRQRVAQFMAVLDEPAEG